MYATTYKETVADKSAPRRKLILVFVCRIQYCYGTSLTVSLFVYKSYKWNLLKNDAWMCTFYFLFWNVHFIDLPQSLICEQIIIAYIDIEPL